MLYVNKYLCYRIIFVNADFRVYYVVFFRAPSVVVQQRRDLTDTHKALLPGGGRRQWSLDRRSPQRRL